LAKAQNVTIARNVTKERLQQNKVAFGFQIRFVRSTEIARAAAFAGYHFLFIDLEHSTMDLDAAAHMCAACLDAGLTPIVRIPSHHHYHATRILEGGAQGIIFPHVHSAEQAREAVANCKFPPIGRRSNAGSLVHMGWQPMPVGEVARLLNDNVLIIALIESLEGIENIDEIAAVEGVDVLSVGSNDLALDMGVPGDYEHAKVQEAYTKVLRAAKRHSKAVRLGGVYDFASMQRNIELGARLVTITSDLKLLMNGMRSSLADFRSRIAPELTAG
jgi:2-keto-3-deoxy-L-rhamnonate aldolase RhmA